MSNVKNLFSDNGILWSIRANNISGNYNQVINLDSSSNFAFSRSGSKIATLGSTLITPSTSSLYDGLDVSGTYFSNSVSAIRIPADTSNNRPTGVAGYVRYNTDTDVIEYWNASTNAWVPISEPSPVVTSISPGYVPEDSSLNYTITGTNFDNSAVVTFKGDVDNIIYSAFGGTTFIDTTTLQARNTLTMSDASSNTGFFVIVTNTNSGLSGISLTPLLTFNTGPTWITASLQNLGTGINGLTYTTVTTPFTAIQATDIHLPISYAYDPSGGAPSGAPGVLLDVSMGKLIGTVPNIINNSTTYTFIAIATDASGSISVPRTFAFTVSPTSYTLTSPTGAVTTGFFTPNLYGSTGLSIPFVAGATTTGYAYTIIFNTDVSLNVLLKGGDGGGGYQYNYTAGAIGPLGGGGAAAFTKIGYTAGTSYKLLIGGGGSSQFESTNAGSYVNGGGGLAGSLGFGGQGGGYTGLFTTSTTFANANLVAAGGGGGAWEVYYYTAQLTPTGEATNPVVIGQTNGGPGGDLNGIAGLTSNSFPTQSAVGTSGTTGASGGGAGTQSAGGAGGSGGSSGTTAGSGTQLTGGNCGISGDGGGGGGGGSGYYGGGAGTGDNPGSSGGGGSSYTSNNGLTVGGIPSTAIRTNGSAGYASIYYSLNLPVSLTFVSGTSLPTPTTINGNSLCYIFNTTGAVPGVTTTYTFTINYPVVLGYLCVAGGGGGGGNGGGGGGGGGLLQGTTLVTANTNITIVVGKGGNTSAFAAIGNSGVNSSISGGITSTITAVGGGGGGTNNGSGGGAINGGSGGGGGSDAGSAARLSCAGATGTQGQGYAGGFGMHISGALLGGGGGGGAGSCGSNLGPQAYNSSSAVTSSGGTGGRGLNSYITGSQVGYAGGGGGGMNSNTGFGNAPGWGGGGTSSNLFGAGNGGGGFVTFRVETPGTNGTGGGGGGGQHPSVQVGAAGGSGVVVIRIPTSW